MTGKPRKIHHQPRYQMKALLGSEGGLMGLDELKDCQLYGLSLQHGSTGYSIYMDYVPPRSVGPDGNSPIAPHQYVAMRLPDKESLQRLTEQGHWPFFPPDWWQDSGSAADGLGSCADPRLGSAHATIAAPVLEMRFRAGMRKFADHERRLRFALDGKHELGGALRLRIQYPFSLVGGSGTGITKDLPDLALGWSDLERVPVLQELLGLLLGTLPHTNRKRALINQTNTLKYWQVRSTGQYRNTLTGHRMPCPIDGFYLASNINGCGTQGTLEQVRRVQGRCLFLLTQTPAGTKYEERRVDLDGAEIDELGDPRIGKTQSCSAIQVDPQKVAGHGTASALEALCKHLLAGVDPAKVERSTLDRLEGLRAIEDGDRNLLTDSISRPAGFNGESVAERIEEMFTDQVGSLRGQEGCRTRKEAIESIQTHSLPGFIAAAMKEQASLQREQIVLGLEEDFRQGLRESTGIDTTGHVLVTVQRSLATARQTLVAKAAALQERVDYAQAKITRCVEALGEIRRSGRLARILGFLVIWFLVWRINRTLDREGRAMLKATARKMASDIALAEVVQPLGEHLDHRCADRLRFQEAVRASADAAAQTARDWEHADLGVPLGQELAIPEYLRNSFENVCEQRGGRESLVESFLTQVLSQHGSLASLIDMPKEEMRTILERPCQEPFEAAADHLDVLEVFRSQHPDLGMQATLIRQRIEESRGAVEVVGEAHERVPWVKLLVVPDPAQAQWLIELVKSVDNHDGPWIVVQGGDPCAVFFLQVRNRISLAPLIRQANLSHPKYWPQLVAAAADPVTALMPNVGPSLAEVRRTLAKALLMKSLSISGTAAAYDDGDGHAVILGTNLQGCPAWLAHHYSILVRIESVFAHQLMREPSTIEAQLLELSAAMSTSSGARDPLIDLIDPQALEEIQSQIVLLTPYLSRLRTAAAVTTG